MLFKLQHWSVCAVRPCFPDSNVAGSFSLSSSSYCHVAFQLIQHHLVIWVCNTTGILPCQTCPSLVKLARLKATAGLVSALFTLMHVFKCRRIDGVLSGLTFIHGGCRKAGEAKRGYSSSQWMVAWQIVWEFKPFVFWVIRPAQGPPSLHLNHFSSSLCPPGPLPAPTIHTHRHCLVFKPHYWLIPSSEQFRYIVLPFLNFSKSSGLCKNCSSNWKAETEKEFLLVIS